MSLKVDPAPHDPGHWHGAGGWQARAGSAALAFVVQALVLAVLLLGLSPAARQAVRQNALAAFVVDDTPPPPPPSPIKAPLHAAPQAAALSGAAGAHAVPRAVIAPVPLVPLVRPPAPQVSASGSADTSGMRDAGSATVLAQPVRAAAMVPAAPARRRRRIGAGADLGQHRLGKGLPRSGRDARIGHSALIVFTVGTDGRAHDCHVRESSGDADSDAITCKLAQERFRFRPATDASGRPVEQVHGWRQSWFYGAAQNLDPP
jgi:protein TonB